MSFYLNVRIFVNGLAKLESIAQLELSSEHVLLYSRGNLDLDSY